MHLEPAQEIVGTLIEVKTKQDQTKLIFTICEEIEIPARAIPKAELLAAVGKRIGIFNCGGIYKLRKIKT